MVGGASSGDCDGDLTIVGAKVGVATVASIDGLGVTISTIGKEEEQPTSEPTIIKAPSNVKNFICYDYSLSADDLISDYNTNHSTNTE
jgi:hypothetical protein